MRGSDGRKVALERMLAAALVAASIASPRAATGQEDRREQALSLVNEARSDEGLDALTLDERLTAAAEAHAEDMLARDYYAHVSPEGEDVRDRFLAEGGDEWLRVSENIGVCRGCPMPPGPDRVRAFHEGWMESPEHRENILDPGLDRFGFAMAAGEESVYAVQTFAGPGRPDGLAADETEREIPPEERREAALAAVNRAREAEGLEPLERSPGLDEAAARLTEGGAVREGDGALGQALSAADGGNWTSVGMLSGECGGCGTVPTAADARNFVESWLEEPPLAETLLDPRARSFGFALSASGEGRKGAVALTGMSG